MPLVPCPDCGNRISDAAPACIHCGRPSSAGFGAVPQAAPAVSAVPVGTATPPAEAQDARELRCPVCRSAEVRRLAVIHSEGLSTASSVGRVAHQHGHHTGDAGHDGHAGHAGDQDDRDIVRTVTTVQTRASAQAAPPARKEAWLFGCTGLIMALLAGIIFGVFASVPGFLLAAGLTGWVFWRKIAQARRWNAEVYPGLQAAWERTFQCIHCGARFETNV